VIRRIVFGQKLNKISDDDTLVELKDINHCKRLYQKIHCALESFDEVHIFFLLDKSKYIRHIIKESDSLLKVKGKLIVHATNNKIHSSYVRSVSQIKSEISLSIKARYHLTAQENTEKVTTIHYTKFSSSITNADSMANWSFGIITNGSDFDLVKRLVKSIEVQNILNYEVIISGPKFNSNNEKVKNIGDQKAEDIRAPICKKKNKIVKEAKFQNLAIFHARYELPNNWYKNMKKFGNLFEILILPTLTHENNFRINDWSLYRRRFIAVFLPKYTYFDQDWYAQGGVIISKKRILEDVPLNENLHWDEFEDVTFSNELKIKGYTVYLDKENHLLTTSNRIKSKNINSKLMHNLYMMRVIFLRIYNFFKNMYKFNLNRYL